jgi:hypothetical protein
VQSYPMQIGDTGKTVKIQHNTNQRGYYSYKASVSDNSNPENESKQSDSLIGYTGIIEASLSESFNSENLLKYYNIGAWSITDKFYKSSPYSITETIEGKYKANSNYILGLFPIDVREKNRLHLSFWHTAIVDKSDSAIVEVEFDDEGKWHYIADYNKFSFAPWQDGKLDENDWKQENIVITMDGNKSKAVIRFRLKSGPFIIEDGWYIDDIFINAFSSLQELEVAPKIASVYPNPSQDFLRIFINNNFIYESSNIIIYNSLGDIMNNIICNIESPNTLLLDISNIPSGVYFIKIESKKEYIISNFIKIQN